MSRSSSRAFTLTELLIVLAILGIFASISLSAFSGSRKGNLFKEEFGKVVDLVQDTRSKALSNAMLNSSGETADAFYLVLDNSGSPITVELFADLPDASSDEILDAIELDGSIQLTMTPSDLEKIEYRPPTGELELVFTSESSGTDVTEVTLLFTDGRSSQTLYLNEISGVPEIVN